MKVKNFSVYAILTAIALFMLTCNKQEVYDAADEEIIGQLPSESSYAGEANREIQPTILGKKKKNPFSIENMRIALDTLIANIDSADGIRLKSVKSIKIEPTDFYVRFLPKDSAEYELLTEDTTLTLFDVPLDYEIKQLGDYYHDPKLTTPFTWQYTTVKPDFIPPKGIKYELLSKLFIIENCPSYTEEDIGDISSLKSTNNTAIIDNNIANALYAVSFKLTGNEKELATYDENDSRLKTSIHRCKRYCVGIFRWRRCWSFCSTYYYPNGRITLDKPSPYNPSVTIKEGLKGVTVRMWRWFSYTDAKTNAYGYYQSRARFRKIWVGNDLYYKLIFKGKRGNNRWTFKKTLFGAMVLWRDGYGMGFHHPNGYSLNFSTESRFWGRCVLNNAIYNYMGYAQRDGIALPPSKLDLADKKSTNYTSGAPLLKRHFNFSLFYAMPNYGGILATVYSYSVFGWAFPDLTLRFNNKLSEYNKITAIAWHELTHASQLQRMKYERGFWWASNYWSKNVYQQAKNEKTNKDPYGKKGDDNWQIIALSEGWANYREEYLSHGSYLSKNHYFPTTFPKRYAKMFNSLKHLGCSHTNLEKALCTYSIVGFRNYLIRKYPSKKGAIKLEIKSYE